MGWKTKPRHWNALGKDGAHNECKITFGSLNVRRISVGTRGNEVSSRPLITSLLDESKSAKWRSAIY